MSLVIKETGKVYLRLVLCVLFRSELTALGYVDPIVTRGDPYDFAEVLWANPPDDADHMAHDGRMRAAILMAYPDLAEIDITHLTSETFETWLAAQVFLFGEWLTFTQKSYTPYVQSTHDQFLHDLYSTAVTTMHLLGANGLIPADKRRGVLAVFHESQPTVPLFKITIGDVPADKIEDYSRYAEEKAIRLIRHAPEGHRLSSDSRDDSLERYAGAVMTTEGYVLSFSGIPQIDDEAYVLTLAVHHGVMESERATLYATMAKNERYAAFAAAR